MSAQNGTVETPSSASRAALNVATPPAILLVGNPNSGKTTLFNALTGARAKVGNYPGVTVERRVGKLRLAEGQPKVELVDLPGTYSLSARSAEEQVAVDAVLGREVKAPDAVVLVLDATALARGLYLATQIADAGVPVVYALNLIDEADRDGIEIDGAALSERLGAPVVKVSASKRTGLDDLRAAVLSVLEGERVAAPLALEPATEADVAKVETAFTGAPGNWTPRQLRTWAIWAMLSVESDDELRGIPEAVRNTVLRLRSEAKTAGRDLDFELIAPRYARIDQVLGETLTQRESRERSVTDRVDDVLTHPVWGFLAFAAVMALVFESLFAWSDPAIGLIETGVAGLQDLVVNLMPAGALRDLIVDGVVAGVGNVVVFVPQIALLFLFIGILEDSGYLARVAFVIDRLMGGVGLHGKAFVPLLSGFACAVPAVMATRTIENRRDRLLTMLVLPLTSCSARLPVYVLVIATVFREGATVGIFGLGAVVLFSMYMLSIVAALVVAFVLRRTVLKGPKPTLVLELPHYRMPVLQNLIRNTWERVRSFLTEAGTVILAMTIVLWGLLTYPHSDAIEAEMAQSRTVAEASLSGAALEEELARIDGQEAGAQLEYSAAGRVGKAMEPLIEPMGFDWRIGVGILGAFAAREVFVSTLGVVFGIQDADEESKPLRQHLQTATRADGSPLMSPLVGVALMIFFVLACQCMSTIAVVKREAGGWKWALFMVGYMTALAYVVTVGVYQVGSALGFG